MADLMTMFGYDETTAESGVKMILGANPATEYAVICRYGNKNYDRVLTKVMQDNNKALELLKTVDPEAYNKKNRELVAEVVAKTVFVELGPGITVNGKKVDNTWEARRDILLLPTDFYSKVVEFSQDKSNYPVKKDVEEIKKP